MKAPRIINSTAAIAALFATQVAFAGSHTWDVHEVFSTPDGSIQFIELREMGGGAAEGGIGGLSVSSASTGNSFTFPGNLTGSTSFRHLLLATASFAALPGTPTPNYIIPPNFFNQNGDTISYYGYDSWAFPAVPTDCVSSRNRVGAAVAPMSPTNYAGQTDNGSVDACPDPKPCEGDIAPPTPDGTVDVLDLLAIIGSWGETGKNPADINGDLIVDVLDLLAVIGAWGPCKV